MTTFLSLEYDKELFFAQINTLQNIFSFPNVDPDILKQLHTPNSPNGVYKIIAFFFKDGVKMSVSDLDGIVLDGRQVYSYNNVSRLYVDVTSYWTSSGREFRCDVSRLSLNASSQGFLSFVVVRVMDVQSVSDLIF
jgi:hypothetical protein